MIDHISTYATDFLKTKAFYQTTFSVLGYTVLAEFTTNDNQSGTSQRICAFGTGEKATFWVIETTQNYTPRHIAFAAASHNEVNGFYKRALENGGRDNGKPGLRPRYHENYYAAFVIDPDGNDVEAVCHDQHKNS